MNDSTNNTPKESIAVPEWWSPGGGMSYRRDCLPSRHPESIYNYIKNTLRQEPERFGIYMDFPKSCPKCHRSCNCGEE